MLIIQVTKEQIAKANKAREAALLENPEYRLYEERQQLRRQAASQKPQIEDTSLDIICGPLPGSSTMRATKRIDSK